MNSLVARLSTRGGILCGQNPECTVSVSRAYAEMGVHAVNTRGGVRTDSRVLRFGFFAKQSECILQNKIKRKGPQSVIAIDMVYVLKGYVGAKADVDEDGVRAQRRSVFVGWAR